MVVHLLDQIGVNHLAQNDKAIAIQRLPLGFSRAASSTLAGCSTGCRATCEEAPNCRPSLKRAENDASMSKHGCVKRLKMPFSFNEDKPVQYGDDGGQKKKKKKGKLE